MSHALVFAIGLLLGLAAGAALGEYLARRRSPAPVGDAPGTPPGAEPPAPRGVDEAVRPLHDALRELTRRVHEADTRRAESLSSLSGQLASVNRMAMRLTDRTDELVGALRAPEIRGRWGEMQLERVVELGGMVEHCDFDAQPTRTADGKTARPDMVVHLSGGRSIVVDAKVPFGAYLDALDARDPEEHEALLRRHAHQLKNHVDELARRPYIEAFDPTPEFVVLFVPGDPFLDAALRTRPELLDEAMARSVVIATPTTLFALLRTVALGWRQEDFTEKAREIHRLGRELYDRIDVLARHYGEVGQHLSRAAEAYNRTLGSMESRVTVTARRLAEMGVPARSRAKPREVQPVAERPREPRHRAAD